MTAAPLELRPSTEQTLTWTGKLLLWTKNGVLRGTADWSKGTPVAEKPWGGVAEAGSGTTIEIEIDDLVEERALEYLRDPARRDQPWALNASFIAPHFPLIVPEGAQLPFVCPSLICVARSSSFSPSRYSLSPL